MVSGAAGEEEEGWEDERSPTPARGCRKLQLTQRGLSTAAPFVKDDGGNSSESFPPFLFPLVAHHMHSPPRDKDYIDLSFHH